MFSDFIIHMFYKFYFYKGLMLSLACIKKCSSILGKISSLYRKAQLKRKSKLAQMLFFRGLKAQNLE